MQLVGFVLLCFGLALFLECLATRHWSDAFGVLFGLFILILAMEALS